MTHSLFPPREALLQLLLHPAPENLFLGLSMLEGCWEHCLDEEAQMAFGQWMLADLWYLAIAKSDRDFPGKRAAEHLFFELLEQRLGLSLLPPPIYGTRSHLNWILETARLADTWLNREQLAQYLLRLPLNYWCEGLASLVDLLQDWNQLHVAQLPPLSQIWARYQRPCSLAEVEEALADCQVLSPEQQRELAQSWLKRG
jgi:hypothetical protein